jgi:alkylated DNA repair protein alkB homolog 6
VILSAIISLIKIKMLDLENFIVPSVPSTCYYIPNFITEAEEQLLIHNIEKTSPVRWTQLKNRRLINIGGVPTQKGMIAEEIPKYLQIYVDKVNQLQIFGDVKANHILLNEYRAGQGIMSHFDGPLFYPTITTLSIGSHTVLEFHKPRSDEDEENVSTDPTFKLFVDRRSLLILKDDLYHRYMHSIQELHVDDTSDPLIKNLKALPAEKEVVKRETRFSLTIRNVPKTSKFKLKLGK